jgi:hypothetical protein
MDRQCPSCGGFCKKSGCERENVKPKREWVGLTDEELEPMCDDWRIIFGPYVHDFAKAIEAKLKEKNG